MKRRDLLRDARIVAEELVALHMLTRRASGNALEAAERLLALDEKVKPIPGVRATSRLAAELEAPRVGSQAEMVLATIEFCYPVPMTDFEIYARRPPMMEQAVPSTVRARRVALVDGGWVKEVDDLGISPSNRKCIRWGLTQAARERLLGSTEGPKGGQ